MLCFPEFRSSVAYNSYLAQMSEAWRLLARIFQMSFALLWLAHITACLWNAIGRNIAGDTGAFWEWSSLSQCAFV
eukprot:2245460-Amphidinium_carterae.1